MLVMISAEKRSVCVAYMRGRPARDAAIWYDAIALLSLWRYFVDYTFILSYKYICKCIAKVLLISKFSQLKKLIFINVEQPKFVMFIKSEDGPVFYRMFNESYIEKLI